MPLNPRTVRFYVSHLRHHFAGTTKCAPPNVTKPPGSPCANLPVKITLLNLPPRHCPFEYISQGYKPTRAKGAKYRHRKGQCDSQRNLRTVNSSAGGAKQAHEHQSLLQR